MAIYTGSKSGLGDQSPQGGLDTSWQRTEPLLTPAQVRSRFLFGLPLVSAIKNPFTGLPEVVQDPLIADYIDQAVSEVESTCHIELMPVQLVEKHPYDPQEFRSLGYLRLKHRPVASLEAVQITSADNESVFNFDLRWVDVGHLHQGQINILPFLLSVANGSPPTALAGAGTTQAYLGLFGGGQWVPSLIQVTYTTGFKDGQLPKHVNQLIGIITAINILSMLATTYGRSSGTSLSIDGLSQSVSTPGPEIFSIRVAELKEQRDALIARIKVGLGQRIFSGNC